MTEQNFTPFPSFPGKEIGEVLAPCQVPLRNFLNIVLLLAHSRPLKSCQVPPHQASLHSHPLKSCSSSQPARLPSPNSSGARRSNLSHSVSFCSTLIRRAASEILDFSSKEKDFVKRPEEERRSNLGRERSDFVTCLN